MRRIAVSLLLLALAAPAGAISIESVELMLDDAGEPGEAVEVFDASDRVQHFKIHLDETKLGQHAWLVEFWAEATDAGNEIKVLDFKTEGLIANTIDAKISLPRDWPIGTYRLVVTMDGEPIGTYNYEVDGPGEGE